MNKFEIKADFTNYIKVFLEENSKLNLISKNDEKVLYEKHIYDSLAIKLFFEKYGIQKGNTVEVTARQSLEEIFLQYYGGGKNDK